jgi:hypothetical protein
MDKFGTEESIPWAQEVKIHPAKDASEPVSRPRPHPVKQFLLALASLRVTVAILALSILLVFAGTLAMVDQGLWTVVNKYFRSYLVLIPFQLFVPRSLFQVPGSFPFPGGWLLGGLLLVNLIAAHLVRFQLIWKRLGILTIHAGLIILMLSELVTGLWAVEGNMVIGEGTSSNFALQRALELIVATPSEETQWEDVISVPASMLQKNTAVRDPRLPFDIEVVRYMVNSSLEEVTDKEVPNPATAGVGLQVAAMPRPESSGASKDEGTNIASAYLSLTARNGQKLGTYLVSVALDNPQPVKVDDRVYQVALRFKRLYKPYSLYLIKFSFDRYEGTSMARNYSSLVRLIDPELNEDREVLIRMNEPLRHRGDAIYQVDFDKRTEKTTVLQVVRNPGWLLPYISCTIVTLGLIIQFLQSLTLFLIRRVVA